MTQSTTNNENKDMLEQGAAEREKADLEISEVGNATENLKEAKERLKMGEEPKSDSEAADKLTETREAGAQAASSAAERVGTTAENAKEAASRLAEDEKGNK